MVKLNDLLQLCDPVCSSLSQEHSVSLYSDVDSLHKTNTQCVYEYIPFHPACCHLVLLHLEQNTIAGADTNTTLCQALLLCMLSLVLTC